jgi:hypothetical protein
LAIVLSVLLLFAAYDCSFVIFWSLLEEEQTKQWPQNTKGAIRSSK